MRRAAICVLLAACNGTAKAPAKPTATLGLGVELVVFDADEGKPKGLAVVQDRRRVELPRGVGEVRVDGVPSLLVESSVSFRAFSDPDVRVRSQRFERAASGVAGALEGAVGKEVIVEVGGATLRGTLASYDAMGMTLDEGGGRLRVVPFTDELLGVRLAAMAGNGTPALVWEVEAAGGAQLVELVYETEGLEWVAYHDVIVDGGRVDVTTNAGIWNMSGRAYEGVTLKLVERDGEAPVGDPLEDTRGYDPDTAVFGGAVYGGLLGGEIEPGAYDYYQARQVPKKPAADWHIFQLPGVVTVGKGDTRVALASLSGARGGITHRFEDVPKTLIHNGEKPQLVPTYGTVAGYGQMPMAKALPRELVLERDGGADLPGGVVRVYERREEGLGLVAVGRSSRSLAGEKVVIPMALSNDLTGRRVRKTLWQDLKRKILREAFEITLDNRGQTAAKVTVVEHLYRGKTWKIRSESASHAKDGDRTIHFPVNVPAGDSVKLTYEVEYTW